MAVAKRLGWSLLIVALLLGVLAWWGTKANAQSPDRATTLIVPYTEYEYWLLRWSDNEILCRILIDHELGERRGCQPLQWFLSPSGFIRGKRTRSHC